MLAINDELEFDAVPIVGADGVDGVLKYGPVLGTLFPTEFVAYMVIVSAEFVGVPFIIIGEDVPTTELIRDPDE